MSNILCKSCETGGLKLSEHDYCELCLRFNVLSLSYALDHKINRSEAQKLINGYTRRYGKDYWRVEELQEMMKN